jgi:hypothetical protein
MRDRSVRKQRPNCKKTHLVEHWKENKYQRASVLRDDRLKEAKVVISDVRLRKVRRQNSN